MNVRLVIQSAPPSKTALRVVTGWCQSFIPIYANIADNLYQIIENDQNSRGRIEN